MSGTIHNYKPRNPQYNFNIHIGHFDEERMCTKTEYSKFKQWFSQKNVKCAKGSRN